MLNPDELEITRRYEVTCPCCRKKSPLSAWGFVQTHWYERPHGHVGGNTWWACENIMHCLLICPNSCYSNGNNLATRIMDLPIQEQEKRWVFGFIQHVTRLSESGLNQIFEDHYVQYGDGKEIENSKERREHLDDVLDF